MASWIRKPLFPYPLQVALGVVLLAGVHVVVNQSEPGGAAASELGLEAEDNHILLVLRLVDLRELLSKVGLGDVGEVGMDDLDFLGER